MKTILDSEEEVVSQIDYESAKIAVDLGTGIPMVTGDGMTASQKERFVKCIMQGRTRDAERKRLEALRRSECLIPGVLK